MGNLILLVVLQLRMVQHCSKVLTCPFSVTLELGLTKLTFIYIGNFATQKGMVQFKSAATPFLCNSGTIGPRKLKFRI